jgi:membrane protease YdiL (CAAX protease family)
MAGIASGDASATRRESLARRVFHGPHGLRAGWALLLFLVVVNLVGAGVGWLVTHVWAVPTQGPWTAELLFAADAVQFLIVLGATLLMGRIERRDLATYGFPPRRAFAGAFWEGALWGVGSCAFVYALLAVTGAYRVEGLAQHGGAALRYLLLWALAMLAVAVYEELFFRGYPLFTTTRGMGFWPAALLLSLVFGALHYFGKPNENVLDFLNVGLIGLFFCFTVRRTGDVWLGAGWHFTFNFVSMGIMGSPNTGNLDGQPLLGHLLASSFRGPAWLTGGPTGAQASVFTLLMVVVLFALFAWRHPAARYPPGGREGG